MSEITFSDTALDISEEPLAPQPTRRFPWLALIMLLAIIGYFVLIEVRFAGMAQVLGLYRSHPHDLRFELIDPDENIIRIPDPWYQKSRRRSQI